MKVRLIGQLILTWGSYSGHAKWAQCNHILKASLKMEEEWQKRSEWRNVSRQSIIFDFQGDGEDHEPKNVRSLLKLPKCKRMDSSLGPTGRNTSLLMTLSLSQWDSRQISVIQNTVLFQVCHHLSQQWQKTHLMTTVAQEHSSMPQRSHGYRFPQSFQGFQWHRSQT